MVSFFTHLMSVSTRAGPTVIPVCGRSSLVLLQDLHLLTVILGRRLLLKQLHLSAAKWLTELSQIIKSIYWLLLCKPSSHRSVLDKR